METSEYRNLTELLLNVVRCRPGMYLGRDHISKLPNFILGYQFCDRISNGQQDFYFGNNGFLIWYEEKYKPRPMSFWLDFFWQKQITMALRPWKNILKGCRNIMIGIFLSPVNDISQNLEPFYVGLCRKMPSFPENSNMEAITRFESETPGATQEQNNNSKK